jgi:hypothetical protein
MASGWARRNSRRTRSTPARDGSSGIFPGPGLVAAAPIVLALYPKRCRRDDARQPVDQACSGEQFRQKKERREPTHEVTHVCRSLASAGAFLVDR